MKYGLIGKNIQYSLSPKLHVAAYKQEHMDATYELLDIAEEDLPNIMEQVKTMNGVNITVPYKTAVLEYIDELDAHAEEIGAVNTIQVEDGKLVGYNTDWLGVLKPLQERTTLEGKTAIVFGAGGAARAAVYALLHAGADVHIINRTEEKAAALAEHFNCTYGTFPLTAGGDILVNTIPIDNNIPHFDIVFDMRYDPPRTKLLQQAEQQGATIIKGTEMLATQAAEAFYIWTGKRVHLEGVL
ncbi:MAG: shikimate dehydrogenase [Candidatus Woesearchaeota archaeon]|nr:shikimate dehydrogenase [Candidatus Woesearchaeota archaeon]